MKSETCGDISGESNPIKVDLMTIACQMNDPLTAIRIDYRRVCFDSFSDVVDRHS